MIPIAQGLVSIYRADGLDTSDDYDPVPSPRLIGTVRAVIDAGAGVERRTRAEAETVAATMTCDIPEFGIDHTDIGRDWNGTWWEFGPVVRYDGFGLDHLTVQLVKFDGVAPA